MSVMKWFRKNNKRLMAVFASALMVGFLISGVQCRNPGGGARDIDRATYTTDAGKTRTISTTDIRQCAFELNLLRQTDLWYLVSPRLMTLSNNPNYGPVHPAVERAMYQLFFASSEESAAMISYFQREISGLAEDQEDAEALFQQVLELTNAESQQSGLLFYLLLQEAEQAGVRATDKQIDHLLSLRDQMVRPTSPVAPLSQRLTQSNATLKQLREALGNYLTIALYADAMTRGQLFSQPQLNQAVWEQLCGDSVSGKSVEFDASLFVNQVAAPSIDDLSELFESYRTVAPGKVTDENPYGLGYKLPDRVQVEYLKIDMNTIRQNVEAKLETMSAAEREETLETFWSQNKSLFAQRRPAPADSASSEPIAYDPPFDEIVPLVQRQWTRWQTVERGRSLLTDALGRVTSVDSNEKLTDEQREKISDEYAQLAEQLSTEKLPVQYIRTDYLSQAEFAKNEDFQNAVTGGLENPEGYVLPRLFESEPVYQGIRSIHSAPPLQLYETLGPVQAARFGTDPASMYLVRIINVDLARVPQAINDDGHSGPYQGAGGELASGVLYDRLVEDWKNIQAYDLAKKQAEIFTAEVAKADWDSVLEKTNVALLSDDMEPNQIQPYLYPLKSTELAKQRDQIDQLSNNIQSLQQRMQQGDVPQQQWSSYQRMIQNYYQNIGTLHGSLQDAVDAFKMMQESPETTMPILEKPERLAAKVYYELTADVPTTTDYLQRRAFMAYNLALQDQSLGIVSFFNPRHIKARLGYQEIQTTPTADEPDAAAQAG